MPAWKRERLRKLFGLEDGEEGEDEQQKDRDRDPEFVPSRKVRSAVRRMRLHKQQQDGRQRRRSSSSSSGCLATDWK